MFTDDQDIDRQLKAALNVQPSAGFEAGLLRRLQEDLPSRGVTLSTWIAAAAAVVVLAGAWFLVTRDHSDPAPVLLTALEPDAAPIAGGPAVPLPPTARPPLRQPIASARQREFGKTDVLGDRRSAPEVIVPGGQLEAILRIVRDVNAGRLAIPEPAPATPAVPSDLLIPPLVIEPIPLVTIEAPGGSGSSPKGLQ